MAADASKSFGHAFQFQPFTGVHLVSAGMHHGGCQGFYLGALNVGQALAILGKFDPEKTLAAIERYEGHDRLHECPPSSCACSASPTT